MTSVRDRGRPQPDPGYEAEQEVDFGRYARAILTRWWLPLAGIAAGVIIGYLLALGGSEVWKASALIYLGQPYSSGGSIALQSAQTNPSTVKAVATSESVIDHAAAAAGIPPAQLRGKVSTEAVAGSLAKLGQTTEVKLTVQGSAQRPTAVAANVLANDVVNSISGYANAKIANYRAQITTDQQAISAITASLAAKSTSPTEQLLLNLQLTNFQNDRLGANALLTQARLVERAQVLAKAAAVKTTARSRRNTVVVAALIGLILGILAALLWEPLTRRRSR